MTLETLVLLAFSCNIREHRKTRVDRHPVTPSCYPEEHLSWERRVLPRNKCSILDHSKHAMKCRQDHQPVCIWSYSRQERSHGPCAIAGTDKRASSHFLKRIPIWVSPRLEQKRH